MLKIPYMVPALIKTLNQSPKGCNLPPHRLVLYGLTVDICSAVFNRLLNTVLDAAEKRPDLWAQFTKTSSSEKVSDYL